jgi:ComF family protein
MPGVRQAAGGSDSNLPGMPPCTAWNGVRSFAAYRLPLKQALLRLKYLPDRRLAGSMATWLAGIYPSSAWPCQVLIPVPLSDKRRLHRGYNRVELIARELAPLLDLPLAARALARRRDTPSQVGLGPQERRRNVQGAFEADATLVAGQQVLLIDDLLTTGATLSACGRALRRAGVGGIYALTVARAAGRFQ